MAGSARPDRVLGFIRIPIFLTAGGLLVGLIHALARSAEEENVFVALATGRISAAAVPGGVAIAVVSLIAGFSLGPEVPTGMAAAGLAWFAVSRHLVRRRDAETATSAAVSGAWGGLFTAPWSASSPCWERGDWRHGSRVIPMIPVPLSIATLTILIAGIPPTESTVMFVTAVVALVLRPDFDPWSADPGTPGGSGRSPQAVGRRAGG